MSTQNVCFRGAIKKTLCGYPLLSGDISLHFQLCIVKQIFLKLIISFTDSLITKDNFAT